MVPTPIGPGAIVHNVARGLAAGAAIAGVGLATVRLPVAATRAIIVSQSGMDRMTG
jgi:hypothetical protein